MKNLKENWVVLSRSVINDEVVINKAYMEVDVKEAVLKFDYLLKRDKFSKKEIIFNDELKFHNQYINRLRNRLKIIFGDWEK